MALVDLDALTDAARQARARAYAPYSGFAMGAAVLTTADSVITGTLVENVSLGLAMCSERAALFTTVDAGEGPVAVALVAPRTDGAVTLPCGACLQVALELGGPDLAVVAEAVDGERVEARLGDLLPHGPRKG